MNFYVVQKRMAMINDLMGQTKTSSIYVSRSTGLPVDDELLHSSFELYIFEASNGLCSAGALEPPRDAFPVWFSGKTN